ncbi:MAG: hypothetical protein E7543_05790 [Ruminococcaceae bacterium]|nr:hypothetical protein [Oscillospiraceae bacterium]
MKKIVALLLVVVMCMLFAACGADSSETVIGEWIGKYTNQSKFSYNYKEFNSGDEIELTMNIYKGGTLQVVRKNTVNDAEMITDGIWEIKDDILVTTFNVTNGDLVLSWEIIDEILKLQGSNYAFPKELMKK